MSTTTKKERDRDIRMHQPGHQGRQGRSTLSKIAFWAFFIVTLSCGGITLGLTLADGAPSRSILTMTIVALITTILAALPQRGIPLVTTILSGVLFYLLFTEAYVIEHLTTPKAPQGGFGAFVGDVVIVACLLVAAGASLGAAIQNLLSGSKQAPRWLPMALSLVVGMVIGAVLIGAISSPPASTSTTYTNGVPTVHMNAGSFLQTTVTVTKGSKLLLVDDLPALHVLANGSWQNGSPVASREPGAPVVNNVEVHSGSVELGPFSTAGTYHIYCTVHPGMNLTIIVQ